MKYIITYSCGHTGEVQLFGPTTERENKLDWYKNSALCPECYKAQMRAEDAAKGLVLEVSLMPFDVKTPVRLVFSGDTLPHKEAIKALGGYSFRYLENDGIMGLLSTTAPGKGWQKCCGVDQIEAEIAKAQGIGATVQNRVTEVDLIAYQQAKAKHDAQEAERKAKMDALGPPPAVPEVLKGHKWNQRVYGNAGNYTVYPDGVKTGLTDAEANEIMVYLKETEAYGAKIAKMKS